MNKNIITVEKNDIKKIGNTAYNEDGFLAIICNVDTANIEEILLRNILKCFGDDYKVVSAEDFEWDGVEGCDICYTTNLPYELFEEVWYSEDSADAGNLPDTPKKSNKIVKSILTIIMLVFIGLAANAQEVHGYSDILANKLSEKEFLVAQSGYGLVGDDSDYTVVFYTPSYYDEELTRMTVITTFKKYSDISLVLPWKILSDGSNAAYCCNDTALFVVIKNTKSTNGRITVYLVERIRDTKDNL